MASSIPNLNTLRRGRGGPRLRGIRDRTEVPTDNADGEVQNDAATLDKVVQDTDNDASSSRLSAVELGYLDDKYVRAFTGNSEPAARRFPIINRGTYVRTTAIDLLVSRFLSTHTGRKQVISLGSGSDTRFFRLPDEAANVLYHELDFAANIRAKRAAIARASLLSDRLKTAQAFGSKLLFHEIDLRMLQGGSEKDLAGLEPDLPTLLLSECCLCYLLPEEASAVLDFFAQRLSNSVGIVLYEPIRPGDAFGRTMVTNLASRGIQLQTIKRYASLEDQCQRLAQAGFVNRQGALDVYQIWQSNAWISETERERVEKLEWLDEIEEWKLLASHYCIAWASRGATFDAVWSGLDGVLV